MRIIGIDPGLVATGFAVIAYDGTQIKVLECGEVCPSKKAELSVRLGTIYDRVSAVIEAHKPDVMVIEKLFSHPKFPQTAILLGHARGAAFVAAHRFGLKVVEIEASVAKRSITGSGRASKTQMQRMAAHLAGGQSMSSEHAADAFALAMTYAYKA
jgi:crossover junction endodeoxyribonuclease RuvC